jgi:hypothetical protein
MAHIPLTTPHAIRRSRVPHTLMTAAAILALSGAVAYAADKALVASPWWTGPEGRVSSPLAAPAVSAPKDAIITLSLVDDAGTRTTIVCLAPPDRIKADVLVIAAEDMAGVVANLCKPSTDVVVQPGFPY